MDVGARRTPSISWDWPLIDFHGNAVKSSQLRPAANRPTTRAWSNTPLPASRPPAALRGAPTVHAPSHRLIQIRTQILPVGIADPDILPRFWPVFLSMRRG